MNKRTLAAAVITGSLFATPLFASSFLHKLWPNHQSMQAANLQAKPTNQTKQKNQNYTDFSGSWAGNCFWGTSKEPTSMDTVIKNDGEVFLIDDEELFIGPLYTRTTSSDKITTFEHTSLEWSNDMSNLIMKSSYLIKIASEYPHNTPTPMMNYLGEVTLSLENEQLMIKGQGLIFEDLEQQGDLMSITCTLNKK